MPSGGIPHQAYAETVLAELRERKNELVGSLRSIYFGGGTPSLWSPKQLHQVIEAVRSECANRASAPEATIEITIEANPEDCNPALLATWSEIGINRVSIGVQSFTPSTLAVLGRDHRMGDGQAALTAALAAPLASVSADFILGVPDARAGETAGADPGAVAAADQGVPHLSVYELTIEARTWFGKRQRAGTLTTLPDDRLAELYVATDAALTERGYEHYEVSSYARPGHRAVHNQLYWTGANYVGLGNGAASLLRDPAGGGVRRTNVRSMRRYLEASGAGRIAERVEISASELASELIWLGLRTSDGVAATALAGREGALARLQERGLAKVAHGRVRPTLTGFLFSNEVARIAVG